MVHEDGKLLKNKSFQKNKENQCETNNFKHYKYKVTEARNSKIKFTESLKNNQNYENLYSDQRDLLNLNKNSQSIHESILSSTITKGFRTSALSNHHTKSKDKLPLLNTTKN